MQCCACGAVAQDKTPGDFDGVVIDCPRCGEYEINGTVLDTVLRLGLPECAVALDKAKRLARAAHRPIIDSRCLEGQHGRD